MSILKSFASLFRRKDESVRKLEQILSDPIESELKLIELASMRIISPEARKEFPQILKHDIKEIHNWCYAAMLRIRICELDMVDKNWYKKLANRLHHPQHAEVRKALVDLLDDEIFITATSNPPFSNVLLSTVSLVASLLAGRFCNDQESVCRLADIFSDNLLFYYHTSFKI